MIFANMAEVAQTRVQEAVNKLLQDLDKQCLRRMQGDMHRCAAKCCEQKDATMEEVHNCIQRCSIGIKKAENYIQNELTGYQDRIQRCAMQCQDDIKDKISPDTTEQQVNKYKNEFEACVIKCADTHVALIPSMLKRMKDTLNRITLSDT